MHVVYYPDEIKVKILKSKLNVGIFFGTVSTETKQNKSNKNNNASFLVARRPGFTQTNVKRTYNIGTRPVVLSDSSSDNKMYGGSKS